MTTRKFRAAAAALLTVLPMVAAAGTDNYKHIGERTASGRIETPFYSFEYAPPSETYGAISWNAFRDKTEKRNIVMLIGLSGYDTYALSVLYKGEAAQGQSVPDVAKQHYPSAPFSQGPNPSCVNTPLDKPFQLDGRMLNFLAICVDERSRAVYELSMSLQSLILAMKSLNTVTRESESCVASKAQDPSARCPDYIGTYAGSYKTFISSFAPTGK